MANSKLIIVEGPQGVGKTTITDYLRHAVPYTNLYRLNGSNDSSPTGYTKSVEMYTDLLDYIEKLQNKNINLLFDRTFFTEYVYCTLGFKEFDYKEAFDTFLRRLADFDFDTYYITLYLSDEDEFEKRLVRKDKAINKYAKFSKESSVKQQNTYLDVAKEVQEKVGDKIKVINIDACDTLDNVKNKVFSVINGEEYAVTN